MELVGIVCVVSLLIYVAKQILFGDECFSKCILNAYSVPETGDAKMNKLIFSEFSGHLVNPLPWALTFVNTFFDEVLKFLMKRYWEK